MQKYYKKLLTDKLAKLGPGLGKLRRHACDDYFIYDRTTNTAVAGSLHGFSLEDVEAYVAGLALEGRFEA